MSPRRQRLTTIVLMGVSASGKSTVMAELAARLRWPWLEGDALHPAANVARMAAGIPLDDADRAPWLDAVAAWIGQQEAARTSAVVTCSALRRAYRDRLRRGHPSVWFVHLHPPAQVLQRRIEDRAGHFMPASMLASQLETLEPLGADEPGWAVDALGSPGETAEAILTRLSLDPG
jgi:gluconokinase